MLHLGNLGAYIAGETVMKRNNIMGGNELFRKKK